VTTPEPDPSEPIQVDLARVAGVGTLAWVVALVVCVVLAALGLVTWTPAAVCAVGAVLGVLGVWWSRGHDRMGRRRRLQR
jgi:Flp pilus assembly protein TadB